LVSEKPDHMRVPFSADSIQDARMSLRIAVIAVACIGLLAGCWQKKAPEKREAPPVKVEIAVVTKGDIEKPLIMTGDLTFTADARVAAQIAGQVTSLNVRDGQVVKKGEVLLTVDDTEVQDRVDAARAALKKNTAAREFAKSEWEKNKDLVKTGSVSWIEYERRVSEYHVAAARVEVDKALLAKAEQDLRWTTVASPIDGVLSARYVEVGDWVSKGRQLFEISDYSQIYLKAFLSDKDVARLKMASKEDVALPANVTVDALPKRGFDGRITYIAPAARKGNVFEVRTYLENPDMILREGMFARARIVPERTPNVLRVPNTALLGKVRDNASNQVYVVDKENKVRLTMITVGASDDVHAQVTKGLRENDKVVVYGKELLSTGTRVEPQDSKRPAMIGAEG
jgi:RND family efflux transporter MFP subunit